VVAVVELVAHQKMAVAVVPVVLEREQGFLLYREQLTQLQLVVAVL
jgi:hypothetical protein